MNARRLVSLVAAGALLAGCASHPEMVVRHKDPNIVEAERRHLEQCRRNRALVTERKPDNPISPVLAHALLNGCANVPADYGEPTAIAPSCVDDLYAAWEERCPSAKVKTFLVAITGGLLMGMANSADRYSYADSGRYKGYKTYDSSYRSRYGTTRCRTQIGDSRSYTSCY